MASSPALLLSLSISKVWVPSLNPSTLLNVQYNRMIICMFLRRGRSPAGPPKHRKGGRGAGQSASKRPFGQRPRGKSKRSPRMRRAGGRAGGGEAEAYRSGGERDLEISVSILDPPLSFRRRRGAGRVLEAERLEGEEAAGGVRPGRERGGRGMQGQQHQCKEPTRWRASDNRGGIGGPSIIRDQRREGTRWPKPWEQMLSREGVQKLGVGF